MNWFLIALIAPFLWAVTNFIDKYLVSKHFQSNTGTLILYSAFVGVPISILIAIFKPQVLSISFVTAIIMILNGFLYISYLFPYFKALSQADTSVVVSIFQTIPVFSYVMAFFVLKETISPIQIIGSLLIIIGAVGMTLRFQGKKVHLSWKVLLLQLLASFIIALNYLIFKVFAIQSDFWTVSFWQYLGFAIFGGLLLSFRYYRSNFADSFKKNSKKILSLNVLNEASNIAANIIFTFAALLAPLALVFVINGIQPFFMFAIGLLLTLFFPHLIKEDLNKTVLLQKIFFIVIIGVGAYLIQ